MTLCLENEESNDQSANLQQFSTHISNDSAIAGTMSPIVQTLPPQRPQRNRRVSTKLSGFDYELLPSLAPSLEAIPSANSSKVYPLSQNLCYSKFTHFHKAFLASITSLDEPRFFHQVVKDPRWRHAMDQEIRALEENQTWSLEHLPFGKQAIDSKWVYKIK